MCISVFQERAYDNDPGGGGTNKLLHRPQLTSIPEEVRRTRLKIGAGVTISRDSSGSVWLYNKSSDYPLFVNTPMYDLMCRHTIVIRVAPGFSVKIYDYGQQQSRRVIGKDGDEEEETDEKPSSFTFNSTIDAPFIDGPYDASAVRVSFAKGWGDAYKRQFITSCPCWLEVLLKVNR